MPWIGGERKLNLSGGIDAVTMWGVPAALELGSATSEFAGNGPSTVTHTVVISISQCKKTGLQDSKDISTSYRRE